MRPSASSCLSILNNSASTGEIFVKFRIEVLFENLSRKFKFHYNLTTITGTLHEDRYTFLIICRSVLLRMRNVSDKSCRENQNTHFMLSNVLSKIMSFMRKCGKYSRTGQATDDNTVHAHCMLEIKTTNTHSEYVILYVFPLQQWWHERSSMSLYSYFAWFVLFRQTAEVIRPRNDSGVHSFPSNYRGFGTLPGQSLRNVWWK